MDAQLFQSCDGTRLCAPKEESQILLRSYSKRREVAFKPYDSFPQVEDGAIEFLSPEFRKTKFIKQVSGTFVNTKLTWVLPVGSYHVCFWVPYLFGLRNLQS